MPAYRTCDVCRKRKIKCIPNPKPHENTSEDQDSHKPCTSCDRLRLDCTYNHVYGRPGRRSGLGVSPRLLSEEGTPYDSSMKRHVTGGPHSPQYRSALPLPENGLHPNQRQFSTPFSSSADQCAAANETDLPAWTALTPQREVALRRGNQRPPPDVLDSTAVPESGQQILPAAFSENLSSTLYSKSRTTPLEPNFSSFILPSLPESTLQPASSPRPGLVSDPWLRDPQNDQRSGATESNTHRKSVLSPSLQQTQPEDDFQIENIAPWDTISFFIRLYLGYLHSLAPIVHRPSFSQDLAMRRDRLDKDFRALCLGIAAYTIGQSPLSRMQGPYSRSQLEVFQHSFHRASIALLDRSYRSPSIVHIGTLLTGYFYCRSVGKSNRAAIMLAEACQLVRLMRLHDDSHVLSLGLNVLDVQLHRRIFWHTYAVDITEASSGLMIHLNSFEGLPQLPEEVDDELITTAGIFEQPTHQQSYMSGFVQAVRLFPILEECLVRRRRWYWHGGGGVHPDRRDAGEGSKAAEPERRWVESAETMVDDIMEHLPDLLSVEHSDTRRIDERSEGAGLTAILGMQRANLTITAVSVRLALHEYRACLRSDSSFVEGEDSRVTLSRQAYRALSAMPFDDLAANGESIRGKISRVLIALLGSDKESIDWLAVLQDWWNIFIQIQSVQLVSASQDSRLPSPTPSPQQNETT